MKLCSSTTLACEKKAGATNQPESCTYLLSMQIITVVHVLVFAQVGGDLAHFCVKLHIYVLLLAKQDRILQGSIHVVEKHAAIFWMVGFDPK